jgi:hypothetical protein
MERRDLYQDDLTEERDPSPAQRDDVAATEVLDPDTLPNDGDVSSPPAALGDPETDDDDEDEDDEDDED